MILRPGRFLAAILLAVLTAHQAAAQAAPVYEGNALLLPEGFDTWVFVGSDLGLVYKKETTGMTPLESARAATQAFHNIYMDKAAYDAFMADGTFPDPTVLVMELYLAESKDPGGVLTEGVFNGRRLSVEVAVKDSHRPTRPGSEGIWAYYQFPVGAAGAPAPKAVAEADADCFDCHTKHAGYDHVWVQFYPRLRARLGQ